MPNEENQSSTQEVLDFEGLKKENPIIKVIGVGGGGGNAVNHMYRESIQDVSFVVCNTDRQALSGSPVPVHLQLGEGLGAGNIPAVARKAAEDGVESIHQMLNDGTKMSFITAGMGGGTGTGAAPVVARLSKELGILTVGIVTIPFQFEGANKIDQALDGVEEMAKHVDALLVINNERLRQIYPDCSVLNAFAKADDTLNIAVRSITEIITVHGLINLDFNDVRSVLKDGGVAIMSTGYGEGEGRVKNAIHDALNSPLLNENDVFNSKKILLNITFAEDKENGGLMMEEMNDVHEFMSKFGNDYKIKWGLAVNPAMGKQVKVTILATGFGIDHVDGMGNRQNKNALADSARLADEEEHRLKQIKRREDYYGVNTSTPYKPRPNIYIFKQEDLDNEDIIMAVESTTTARRSRKSLDRICNISKGEETGGTTSAEVEIPDNRIVF
ncbi:MAG: cell division protein FtsZ [Prevotella sp.]|nr:cell division protein FtsZ [Prevotella sp.]